MALWLRGRVALLGLWCRWEVKREDCWVGVFWRDDAPIPVHGRLITKRYARRHVWICLVPCLPLHISWLREADHA